MSGSGASGSGSRGGSGAGSGSGRAGRGGASAGAGAGSSPYAPAGGSAGSAASASGSGAPPVGARGKDYIRRLEERNRAAKASKARSVSKSERDKARREAGFNVYLSGANEERVAEQRARDAEGGSGAGTSSRTGRSASVGRSRSAASGSSEGSGGRASRGSSAGPVRARHDAAPVRASASSSTAAGGAARKGSSGNASSSGSSRAGSGARGARGAGGVSGGGGSRSGSGGGSKWSKDKQLTLKTQTGKPLRVARDSHQGSAASAAAAAGEGARGAARSASGSAGGAGGEDEGEGDGYGDESFEEYVPDEEEVESEGEAGREAQVSPLPPDGTSSRSRLAAPKEVASPTRTRTGGAARGAGAGDADDSGSGSGSVVDMIKGMNTGDLTKVRQSLQMSVEAASPERRGAGGSGSAGVGAGAGLPGSGGGSSAGVAEDEYEDDYEEDVLDELGSPKKERSPRRDVLEDSAATTTSLQATAQHTVRPLSAPRVSNMSTTGGRKGDTLDSADTTLSVLAAIQRENERTLAEESALAVSTEVAKAQLDPRAASAPASAKRPDGAAARGVPTTVAAAEVGPDGKPEKPPPIGARPAFGDTTTRRRAAPAPAGKAGKGGKAPAHTGPTSRGGVAGSASGGGGGGGADAMLPALMSRIAMLNPAQQSFLLNMLSEMEKATSKGKGGGAKGGRKAAPGGKVDVNASVADLAGSLSASMGSAQVWVAMEAGLAAAAAAGLGGAGTGGGEHPETSPTRGDGDGRARLERAGSEGSGSPAAPPSSGADVPRASTTDGEATPGDGSGGGAGAAGAHVSAELRLRLLSTWGGAKMVGLTELEVFDEEHMKVDIPAANVRLEGAGAGGGSGGRQARSLAHLVDGVTKTTAEQHMWLGSMPDAAAVAAQGPLELVVTLPPAVAVGKVKVWNFNKSLVQSSVGVKDAELLLDGEVVWTGQIRKAPGNHMFDSSTAIVLLEPPPVPPPPPEEEKPAPSGSLASRSPSVSPAPPAGGAEAQLPDAATATAASATATEATGAARRRSSAGSVGAGDARRASVSPPPPAPSDEPRASKVGHATASSAVPSIARDSLEAPEPPAERDDGSGVPLWLQGLGRDDSTSGREGHGAKGGPAAKDKEHDATKEAADGSQTARRGRGRGRRRTSDEHEEHAGSASGSGAAGDQGPEAAPTLSPSPPEAAAARAEDATANSARQPRRSRRQDAGSATGRHGDRKEVQSVVDSASAHIASAAPPAAAPDASHPQLHASASPVKAAPLTSRTRDEEALLTARTAATGGADALDAAVGSAVKADHSISVGGGGGGGYVPSVLEGSARKRPGRTSASLEKSWDSLEFFERANAGRLTNSLPRNRHRSSITSTLGATAEEDEGALSAAGGGAAGAAAGGGGGGSAKKAGDRSGGPLGDAKRASPADDGAGGDALDSLTHAAPAVPTPVLAPAPAVVQARQKDAYGADNRPPRTQPGRSRFAANAASMVAAGDPPSLDAGAPEGSGGGGGGAGGVGHPAAAAPRHGRRRSLERKEGVPAASGAAAGTASGFGGLRSPTPVEDDERAPAADDDDDLFAALAESVHMTDVSPQKAALQHSARAHGMPDAEADAAAEAEAEADASGFAGSGASGSDDAAHRAADTGAAAGRGRGRGRGRRPSDDGASKSHAAGIAAMALAAADEDALGGAAAGMELHAGTDGAAPGGGAAADGGSAGNGDGDLEGSFASSSVHDGGDAAAAPGAVDRSIPLPPDSDDEGGDVDLNISGLGLSGDGGSVAAGGGGNAASALDMSTVDIPLLPSGRVLTIHIKSTWGDPHYVGLAGIDVFDDAGKLVQVRDPKAAISAEPPDINVLPGYGSDPRTVDNLLDGVNHTRDDLHVWLAPFNPRAASDVRVTLELDSTTTVSMLRIWNYNKSRIHSYRGARLVYVDLDGQRIFEGEVRKAPGMDAPPEDCSEVILFTDDEALLSAIESHDAALAAGAGAGNADPTAGVLAALRREVEAMRPKTAERSGPGARGMGGRSGSHSQFKRHSRAPTPEKTFEEALADAGQSSAGVDGRPMTSAAARRDLDLTHSSDERGASLDAEIDAAAAELGGMEADGLFAADEDDADGAGADADDYGAVQPLKEGCFVDEKRLPRGRRIRLDIRETWGDRFYVGLTAVQVLVSDGAYGRTRAITFPLARHHVDAEPLDINVDGHTGDPRTLDKLVDGTTVTVDDLHMWLLPFTPDEPHTLDIDLGDDHAIAGLRIWNYNKNPEDTRRGAKRATISIDGTSLTEVGSGRGEDAGVVLRKAPGHAEFDFGQSIAFDVPRSGSRAGKASVLAAHPGAVMPMAPQPRGFVRMPVRQDYEPPLLPCGCLVKLVFESTWGDPYYLGLDGIELYDAEGEPIPIHREQVHALPASVNDILGPDDPADVRTPDNLVRPNKARWDDRRAWLAPLAHSLVPGQPNLVYLSFDSPVTISMMRIWNYSKRPERGARSVEIWIDDVLVFWGGLKKAVAPPDDYRAPPARGGAGLGVGGVEDGSPDFSQPILFTSDSDVAAAERDKIPYCGSTDQDVMCINERQVVLASSAMYVQEPTAVGVQVDLNARPTTSMVTSGPSDLR